MKIKGKYKKDNNFVTVFSGNKIYTIARNTGDCGCLPVGGTSATGHGLTEADYNRMQEDCTSFGEFELAE